MGEVTVEVTAMTISGSAESGKQWYFIQLWAIYHYNIAFSIDVDYVQVVYSELLNSTSLLYVKRSITLDTIDDSVVEDSEDFILTFANLTAVFHVDIVDNDGKINS